MKVLIIGLGWFGKKHLKIWESLRVEVVAILEKVNFKLDKISEQDTYHKDLSSESDFMEKINDFRFIHSLEQIEDLEFDFVDIITNEDTHMKYAKFFLEKGIPVIIEKPIALNLHDVEKLQEIAVKNDTQFYAGHLLRFDARNVAIKNNLSNELSFVRFDRSFQKKSLEKYGHSFSLYTSLIHDIDLLVYFYNIQVKEIKNITYNYIPNEKYKADLVTDITFRWKNAIINLHNDWLVTQSNEYGFISEYVIKAENEFIVEMKNAPDVKIYRNNLIEVPDLFFWNSVHTPDGALFRMLSHYRECIEEKRESEIASMKSIISSYGIIDKLLKSRSPIKSKELF